MQEKNMGHICPIGRSGVKCSCVVPRDNSDLGPRPWALLSLEPPIEL